MYPSGLEIVINNAACRGAFMVDGDAVKPLATTSDETRTAAMRTRDVWASLSSVMSDAGLLVGAHGAGMSVFSQKGGVIVESSGAVNLGILRAALQHEKDVDVCVDSDVILGTSAGSKAIWNLAEWIDAIEAPRQLTVHLGAKTIALTACKGRFAVKGSQTPESVVNAIRSAADEGTPIELSYVTLPEKIGKIDLSPLELFCPQRAEDAEWIMGQNAMPLSMPSTATLADARTMAVLAQRLAVWGQGAPFELSVLRNGKTKEVIAQATNAQEIKLNSPLSAKILQN